MEHEYAIFTGWQNILHTLHIPKGYAHEQCMSAGGILSDYITSLEGYGEVLNSDYGNTFQGLVLQVAPGVQMSLLKLREEVERLGYRLSGLHHLLAFGIDHHQQLLEYGLVRAFGTVKELNLSSSQSTVQYLSLEAKILRRSYKGTFLVGRMCNPAKINIKFGEHFLVVKENGPDAECACQECR